MIEKPLYPEPRVFRRLAQYSPDPSAEGERASLQWQMNGSNPALIVWTRGVNEKGKPPIKANLNTMSGLNLLDNITKVIASPPKTVIDLPIPYSKKVENEGVERREYFEQAVVRVVKTSEGIVQIAVIDKDETRPRILFPFMLDRWNGLVKVSGEPLTEAEVSCMVATNYVRILREHFIKEVELTTDSENKERYPREGFKPGTQSKFQKKPQASEGFKKPVPNFEDINY